MFWNIEQWGIKQQRRARTPGALRAEISHAPGAGLDPRPARRVVHHLLARARRDRPARPLSAPARLEARPGRTAREARARPLDHPAMVGLADPLRARRHGNELAHRRPRVE